MPSPEACLQSFTPGQTGSSSAPDVSSAMKIYQDIFMLGFRVGQEARDLRAMATQRRQSAPNTALAESIMQHERRERVQNLLEYIHQSYSSWRVQVSLWSRSDVADTLHPQVRYCVQRVGGP